MTSDFMCRHLLLLPINERVFVTVPGFSLKQQPFLTFPDIVNALSQKPLVRITRDFVCRPLTGWPKNEMNRALGHLCAHI